MKIACISLGCPKNQVDLDVMVHILLSAGHETVADLGEADVILVNTCGFIESAKTEAIENILEACAYKQQNPELKVIVTGCLAERYRSQIEEEIPEVDAVVGCASNKAIDTIVERLFHGEDHLESYGAKKDFPLGGKRVIGTPAHYAYLKIAEGCNNRCHYCAIPGIRGPLRSRDMADCVAEARWLAGEGVKELIVVAQDTSRYGTDLPGHKRLLPELLRKLCEIDGLHWIRVHYVYPDEIDDEFIQVMASEPKIVKYLDIPIQHCNSKILKLMNRRGDGEFLKALFARLRAGIPGLVIRTSLITGLPGEGEEEFAELCDFLREERLERVGAFAFSPEEGTPAAQMEHVDTDTAVKRAEIVEMLQSEIMDAYNAEKLGKTMEVLVDGYDDVFSDMLDSERARLLEGINRVLEDMIGRGTGFLRRVASGRYIAVVEERHLEQYAQRGYDVLDKIRALDPSVNLSISIGIGRGAKTLREAQDMAVQALDMAQGRGGDQAAEMTPDGFTFYGGVSHGVEKRSKVRSRLVADQLVKLIKEADHVVIMGHRMSDLDAIGAAEGVLRICKICDVPARRYAGGQPDRCAVQGRAEG